MLDQELHKACDYGRNLWRQLGAVRHYLLASLPPDPHTPAASVRVATAPTGPDDEAGWNDWINAYANTVSALAGPQGALATACTRLSGRPTTGARRQYPPCMRTTPAWTNPSRKGRKTCCRATASQPSAQDGAGCRACRPRDPWPSAAAASAG